MSWAGSLGLDIAFERMEFREREASTVHDTPDLYF